MRIQKAATAGGVSLAAVALVAACSSSGSGSGGSSSSPSASSKSSSAAPASASGTLNASGSTFQTTFQQAAIQAIKQTDPNLTVNYGGGGSGKGRTDLASGLVNFAGSDSPIPAKDASKFTGKTILYFPVVIGPIAISYNLSGVKSLKLDGPTIAKIFQGQIKTWNDPAIKALNSGVTLPSTAITIARRSDSSGTTQNFSEFLVKSAPGVWKLGSSSTISWPSNSRGGTGNGGVDSIVKSTPGAIGYVDFSDAKASNLAMASVKNSAGSFVAPSAASASAAAAQATVASDLTFSAIWAPGASSYPITYQSWDLVNAAQSSASTKTALKAYLGYLLGDGQKLLPELNYAPLPASLDAQAKAQLSKIGSGS
ncbi:MAG TPA: phosphate ABC transporter substrate-binding protein PstS [Streptosporangiaceae bacterium]